MSRGSNYPAGGTPASSQIIWLEKRVAELEEKLLKERETTVDDAWQKYCEEMMPQKTNHIYPLAGAMYKTFVTGWNAALKEKK